MLYRSGKYVWILISLLNVSSTHSMNRLRNLFSSFWQRAPLQLAQNSSALGKTHFIVGVDEEQYASLPSPSVAHEVVSAAKPSCKVLFAPDDKVQEKLVSLIKKEKEAIFVAVFNFTDKKIAEALLGAHKRGVQLELVTDSGCLNSRHNKVQLLARHNVPVYVYNPIEPDAKDQGLMHHKFALFKNNGKQRWRLWNGSFNFTRSASQRNQENVMIMEDQDIAKKFFEQFQLLKKRSRAYREPSRVSPAARISVEGEENKKVRQSRT